MIKICCTGIPLPLRRPAEIAMNSAIGRVLPHHPENALPDFATFEHDDPTNTKVVAIAHLNDTELRDKHELLCLLGAALVETVKSAENYECRYEGDQFYFWRATNPLPAIAA